MKITKSLTLFVAILFVANMTLALNLSHEGGFYDMGFTLISSLEEGETAFYTLDGGDPRDVGLPLPAELLIEKRPGTPTAFAMNENKTNQWWEPPKGDTTKATILRIVTYEDGESEEYIHSYFIDVPAYTLPVVSVVVNEKYLTDYDIGFYIKGVDYDDAVEAGWEGNTLFHPANWNDEDLDYPGHYEYFVDESRVLGDAVEVEISGRSSASITQKSLKFSYKKAIGEKKTEYPFFGDESLPEYAKLRIRNAGQDWSNGALMRDCLSAEVFEDENVETMNCRGAIGFINGEYAGLYRLRENIDDKYLAAEYDIDKDDIVMLENEGLLDEGEDGDEIPYIELLDWVRTHDLSTEENYEYFTSQINVESMIDYYICHSFSDNGDFPNDHRYWRNKNPESQVPDTPYDGRWYYFCKDIDQGFGIYSPLEYDDNTLLEMLEGTQFNDWGVDMFRAAMNNDEFRAQFVARALALLDTKLASENTLLEMHIIEDYLRPEIPEQVRRFSQPFSEGKWDLRLADLETWLENRPVHYREHVLGVADWSSEVGNVCYDMVRMLPATCDGGEIIMDTSGGSCRTVICENDEDLLHVFACDKQGTPAHFEMYKRDARGTVPEICLHETCMRYEGFVRSDSYPFCTEDPFCGDGVVNGDEECDGVAPEGFICTEECALEEVPSFCGDGIMNGEEVCDGDEGVPEGFTCTEECVLEELPEAFVTLSIPPWFPQGLNYVFVCNAVGFTPLEYDWYFGDGQKQLRSTRNNVWHTYAAEGEYSVECVARDGTFEESDTIVIGSGD